MTRLLPLDPAGYVRHPIHQGEHIWAETNCYSDVLIELLHGMGFEPRAALAFTLSADFEGDQWTFFKFRDADLERLFALQVEELAPWRPLVEHIDEQLRLGRPVLVELDSYFLPDTQGSAYRLQHTKSTVAINALDPAARHMEYFHNQGYFALQGDDFDALFQTGGLVHPRMLPPYIEFVKRHPRREPLRGAALHAESLRLLREELARLPADNPFTRFGTRFDADLDGLIAGDIDAFHAYAFVTWRQFGACFELADTYLRWLADQGTPGLLGAADELRAIAEGAKAFQFQLARAVARKRRPGLEILDELGARWQRAGDGLRAALG